MKKYYTYLVLPAYGSDKRKPYVDATTDLDSINCDCAMLDTIMAPNKRTAMDVYNRHHAEFIARKRAGSSYV